MGCPNKQKTSKEPREGWFVLILRPVNVGKGGRHSSHFNRLAVSQMPTFHSQGEKVILYQNDIDPQVV
jgi:hypothetical protein